MPNDTAELYELAQATSAKLNLTQFAVEKDYYVTKAIKQLVSVEDDFFSLVFQGGTSLSKGYQAIKRLSEDADFRVIKKSGSRSLGKVENRKRLRDFRHNILSSLKQAGFVIPDERIRVFYEGRFMSIGAEFPSSATTNYLKPHIAIECFVGQLALPQQTRSITTLIKETLGDVCDHEFFPVDCVSLDETAAEKWVALTRRVANTKIKSRQSDKYLVRHLYDLYQLKSSGLLSGQYKNIVAGIIEKDKEQFEKYNPAYSNDPIAVTKTALDSLYKDEQWRGHWNDFLYEMVYEKEKPGFDLAYGYLKKISDDVFDAIEITV